MSEWLKYRKKGITEMRPYVEGETLEGVSVSQRDRDDGHPTKGDMVARDPLKPDDQWLMSQSYFEANYEPALQAEVATPPVTRKAPAHVGPEAKGDPVPRLKVDERKEKDEPPEMPKPRQPLEKDEPKKR